VKRVSWGLDGFGGLGKEVAYELNVFFKKRKSEVVILEYDFISHIDKNHLYICRLCFFEKKHEKPVGWRTTSPIISSSTLII